MSRLSRFKWEKTITPPSGTGYPGFYNNQLSTMRQIPSQAGTAFAGGGPTAVFSAYVPGGSWGMQKNLFIRGAYSLTFGPGIPVPGYNILETIYSPQLGSVSLPAGAGFLATPGYFSTWIQRNLIRVDPDILMMDLGDCMQHNWANSNNNIAHVLTIGASLPPYDYTQPMQIDLQLDLPGTYPGATATGLWMEAFLEQGTNLGKIT